MRDVERLELLIVLAFHFGQVQDNLPRSEEHDMALVLVLRWERLDEIMVAHHGLLERHNLLLTAVCLQTEHADYLVGQIKQEVQSIPIVVHGVIEGSQVIVLPI